MKRFLCRFVLIGICVVLSFAAILFLIPRDNNAYLCEYNEKVILADTVSQPRILFIGGSDVAFGLNSKYISEQLGMNVVNLGMHGGIGSKYYLSDFLQFVKGGDIVVVSPIYTADYNEGGNGRYDTLISLMVSTGWRNFSNLNRYQYLYILEGIPFYCFRNVVRLVKSPIRGFDTPVNNEVYTYTKSGFNKYGDEESHWHLPNDVKGGAYYADYKKDVNTDYVKWLKVMIDEYNAKGVTVLLAPQIISHGDYNNFYPSDFAKVLKENGLDLFCEPDYLMVEDSCGMEGGSHLNKLGVDIISQRLSIMLCNKLKK